MLILASILPALILVGHVCIKDRQQPEPFKMLLKAFLFGMFSAAASLCISIPAASLGLYPSDPVTVGDHFAVAFFGAAVPEELAKLFMLWLALRHNPWFDESFDGIVYAVCVGMGFAFAENIGYLAQAGEYWMATGITRGLISVPGHYAFAVIMGYYYSKSHFACPQTETEDGVLIDDASAMAEWRRNRWKSIAMMIVLPILAHGTFDWILMVSGASEYEALSGILTVVFFVFFIWMQRFARRHLRSLIGK